MEPKLKAPGAPLPLLQRILFRFGGKYMLAKLPWEIAEKKLRAQFERILSAVALAPKELMEQRVLVAKRAGLEDSSRNWSAAMALHHLCISHEGMLSGIELLESGEIPSVEADTKRVKPLEVSASVAIAEYRGLAERRFPAWIAQLERRNPDVTWKHPWFGELRSQEWFAVMVFHQSLHEGQLRDILQAVGAEDAVSQLKKAS